ncbi:ACT domain-containing protein [Peribacillus frigoritolerans]|uniref:ACT domain-containing protein n=1 Tax=Peribacillus frigoritolerans TaxID=450367 RepID=UPI0039A11249
MNEKKEVLPLRKSYWSIFAISTYNTDYLLVKSDTLEQTLQILSEHGHSVI